MIHSWTPPVARTETARMRKRKTTQEHIQSHVTWQYFFHASGYYLQLPSSNTRDWHLSALNLSPALRDEWVDCIGVILGGYAGYAYPHFTKWGYCTPTYKSYKSSYLFTFSYVNLRNRMATTFMAAQCRTWLIDLITPMDQLDLKDLVNAFPSQNEQRQLLFGKFRRLSILTSSYNFVE